MQKINLIISLMLILISQLILKGQTTFQLTLENTSLLKNEYADQIKETSDNGYIVAGTIYATTTSDILLLKLDNEFNIQWGKTYGGTDDDEPYDVIQTIDKGFLILGTTNSFGSAQAIYLIKTDSAGNHQWSKQFNGANYQRGVTIKQTTDGGYLIIGTTLNYGAGNGDMYLIKLNSLGQTQWSMTYGGAEDDDAITALELTNGNFVVLGYNNSFNSNGYRNICLLKVNSTGNVIWSKMYEENHSDLAYGLTLAKDGGFFIAGSDCVYSSSSCNAIVIKTDSSGAYKWSKYFDGGMSDRALEIASTNDGGAVINGITESFSSPSNKDIFLLKLSSTGNYEWLRVYGGSKTDALYQTHNLIHTQDNGFVICGSTSSFGIDTTNTNAYIIKTDSSGMTNCNLVTGTMTAYNFYLTEVSNIPFLINSGATQTAVSTITSNYSLAGKMLCSFIGINDTDNMTNDFVLFPNPFHNSALLKSTQQINFNNSELKIVDIYGKIVKTISGISQNEITIECNDIGSGLYFYQLTNQNTIIAKGKFILK